MNPNTNRDSDIDFASGAWEELAKSDLPWLFEDTIQRGVVTALSASGGTGKSMFTTGLALSVALGKTIFPSFVPTSWGKVLVLSGEDPDVVYAQRVKGFIDTHGLRSEDLNQILGKRLFVRCQKVEHLTEPTANGRVECTEAYDELCETVSRLGIDLLVIDTCRRWAGLPENDNSAMGEFVQALGDIAEEMGCAVLLLHHTSKHGAGGDLVGAYAMRGASAIGDEVRAVYELSKGKTEGTIILRRTKCNYRGIFKAVQLEFDGPALREVRRSVQELVPGVYDWVKANPGAAVNDVRQRKRQGKVLAEAMAKQHPWADYGAVNEALDLALQAGNIVEKSENNGHGKMVVRLYPATLDFEFEGAA